MKFAIFFVSFWYKNKMVWFLTFLFQALISVRMETINNIDDNEKLSTKRLNIVNYSLYH